ncbi:MAG TPA: glycosyltransferase 87 family protein [Candidatus Limnocylindria bacterium]|nr:glycosyltransferase 87 family protein [Candidatus Limnocylindria bacterium]
MTPSPSARWRPVAVFLAAAAAAFALGAALGVYHLHANDLWSIWSGPRALALGHDVYDPAAWDAALRAAGAKRESPVYVYPPWTLAVLAPFGLLTFDAMRVVWTVGGALAAVAAVGALVHRLRAPAAAAAAAGIALALSAPAITAYFNGQWGFALTAALAVAVLGARSNAPAGAAGTLVLFLKPQLVALAAPGLLVHAWRAGSRRFVVASVATVAIVVLAGAVLSGPGSVEWLRQVPPFIARNELSDATIAGLLRADTAAETTAIGAIALLLGAVALYLLARRAEWLPTCLAASVALAPHARSYDQLVLVVPLLLAGASRTARARSFALAGWAALVAGSLLLYAVALARGDESWSVVTPLACTAAVAAAALADGRRGPPRTA